ncbi:MAG: hypothetical protein HS115_14915 [Spirochaetales bacterium]|nr:hypothetical protein [Spirochaetales bacterium]
MRQLVRSISPEEYHLIAPDEDTELIEGDIVQKMSKSPLQANTIKLLANVLAPL